MMIGAIVVSFVIILIVFFIAAGVNIITDDWTMSLLSTILGLSMFFVLVMVVYALMGGK